MTPLVLSTRPDGPADPIVAGLEADGWRVAAVPTVAFAAVPPGGDLDRVALNIAAADWVVITSRRGVDALAEALARIGCGSFATGPRRAWIAVGRATARALTAGGASPILVPVVEGGAALAQLLIEQGDVAGATAILPRADAADPALAAAMRVAGIIVEDVVAYRTLIAPEESEAGITAALADPELRTGILASGSAVRGLVSLAWRAGPDAAARLRTLPLVSIGPSTSTTIRAAGLRLGAEASEPTIDGLRAAVRLAVEARADDRSAGEIVR